MPIYFNNIISIARAMGDFKVMKDYTSQRPPSSHDHSLLHQPERKRREDGSHDDKREHTPGSAGKGTCGEEAADIHEMIQRGEEGQFGHDRGHRVKGKKDTGKEEQ